MVRNWEVQERAVSTWIEEQGGGQEESVKHRERGSLGMWPCFCP